MLPHVFSKHLVCNCSCVKAKDSSVLKAVISIKTKILCSVCLVTNQHPEIHPDGSKEPFCDSLV